MSIRDKGTRYTSKRTRSCSPRRAVLFDRGLTVIYSTMDVAVLLMVVA
ncbi:MAG: hypothetical protein WCG94_01410 [Methanothrix sp.]